MEGFNEIISQIDVLERDVMDRINQDPTWDRQAETITDRMAQLAAKVHDVTHNKICTINPDCPVYRRSMLRRVRKTLMFES